jgi:hypothetical protein
MPILIPPSSLYSLITLWSTLCSLGTDNIVK